MTIRSIAPALALVTIISGCDKFRETATGGSYSRYAAVAPAPQVVPIQEQNDNLAYSRTLELEVDPQRVRQRAENAANFCLRDAAKQCVLISLNLIQPDNPGGQPDAKVEVRLTHESVQAFIDNTLSLLPGEAPGSVFLATSNIHADDLSHPIADATRALSQLNKYSEKLTALAARPDIKVEELIKIAEVQSETEQKIQTLTGDTAALKNRVETEYVSLHFMSARQSVKAVNPIINVWRHAGQTLVDSTASALAFCTQIIPWLPVFAISLLLVRLLWRLTLPRLRRRK